MLNNFLLKNWKNFYIDENLLSLIKKFLKIIKENNGIF